MGSRYARENKKKGIFGYKRFLFPLIKPVCSSSILSSVPHKIATLEEAVPVPFRHRGDVDPHVGGLGACEPDGCTVVVEVRATVLFESLGGGVEEAHVCEEVVCLAVGQYV